MLLAEEEVPESKGAGLLLEVLDDGGVGSPAGGGVRGDLVVERVGGRDAVLLQVHVHVVS